MIDDEEPFWSLYFLQIQQTNSTPIANESVLAAEYMNIQQIACPISPQIIGPNLEIKRPYVVDVHASNNGAQYSDAYSLIVYNSMCWNCANTTCNTLVSARDYFV